MIELDNTNGYLTVSLTKKNQVALHVGTLHANKSWPIETVKFALTEEEANDLAVALLSCVGKLRHKECMLIWSPSDEKTDRS